MGSYEEQNQAQHRDFILTVVEVGDRFVDCQAALDGIHYTRQAVNYLHRRKRSV